MKKFFVLKNSELSDKEVLSSFFRGDMVAIIKDEKSLNEAINSGEISRYRKIDAFREGSIVRLVGKRPYNFNDAGLMDKFLSREVVIKSFDDLKIYFDYERKNWDWKFFPTDIEEVIKY